MCNSQLIQKCVFFRNSSDIFHVLLSPENVEYLHYKLKYDIPIFFHVSLSQLEHMPNVPLDLIEAFVEVKDQWFLSVNFSLIPILFKQNDLQILTGFLQEMNVHSMFLFF